MLHFSITMSKCRNVDGGARRRTPLTTRSIVLSLLLGSHPPEMPVSALVEFCGLFDVAPGTVRTALSRMVERGELTTDDARYRPERPAARPAARAGQRAPASAGRVGRRLVRGDRHRRTTHHADRRDFRARAIGSKLGELRPDLWMRPANIEIPHDLPDCS